MTHKPFTPRLRQVEPDEPVVQIKILDVERFQPEHSQYKCFKLRCCTREGEVFNTFMSMHPNAEWPRKYFAESVGYSDFMAAIKSAKGKICDVTLATKKLHGSTSMSIGLWIPRKELR